MLMLDYLSITKHLEWNPMKKTIIISEVNIIGKVQFKFLFISSMYKWPKWLQQRAMKITETRKHYGNPCGLGKYRMWLQYPWISSGTISNPDWPVLYHIAKDTNVWWVFRSIWDSASSREILQLKRLQLLWFKNLTNSKRQKHLMKLCLSSKKVINTRNC